MKIMVIPDTQMRPGVSTAYLTRIGKYAAEKRPDVIVHLGDHADMPSLSTYDKGKKSFEGRRYSKDVEAAQRGMDALTAPIAKVKGYTPEKHILYGNHEHRIVRAADDDAMLGGLVSLDDLGYKSFGWEAHEFLQPLVLSGIAFCHYFTSGVMGRPVQTAAALLSKKHMSCIAGHQQGRQIAYAYTADGRTLTAMIVGSAYEHHEDYLGPQGNKHWRGIVMLHEVRNGQFDEMLVSMDYLKRRFDV